MIPAKILKKQKRIETAILLEKLVSYGYSNVELGEKLKTNSSTVKVKISGLRLKKGDYPISLKKLEPIYEKAKELLEETNNNL